MPLAPLGAVAAPPLAPARPAAPGQGSFAAILEAVAQGRAPLHAATSPEGLAAAARRGLESIERAQARLDALLAAGRSGRTFTASELIALQSQAYRCGQTLELSAKLVEQGAQAVKQALHAQV